MSQAAEMWPCHIFTHYHCHCFHFDHNHIIFILLDSAWSSPLNQGGRFRPQLCCRLLAATREACGTSYPGAAYYFMFPSSLFFYDHVLGDIKTSIPAPQKLFCYALRISLSVLIRDLLNYSCGSLPFTVI